MDWVKKIGWIIVVSVWIVVPAVSAQAENIVVEAEHYSSLGPPMVVNSHREASGGKFVEIPKSGLAGSAKGGQGYTEYRINIPQNGAYQLWGRVWWHDHTHNSFYVLVDTTAVSARTPDIHGYTYQKWDWTPGPVLRLTKGVHVVRFQQREEGSRLDQWLLTLSPMKDWTPKGVYPQTDAFLAK